MNESNGGRGDFVLTPREVAERHRVSECFVHKLIRLERLAAVDVGSGKVPRYRISIASVKAWFGDEVE